MDNVLRMAYTNLIIFVSEFHLKMLILVTGTSRGIGEALIHHLATVQRAKVIAVSRKPVPAAKQHKDIIYVKADISTEQGRAVVAKAVKSTRLPLAALVNNAGAMLNKPFGKITPQQLSDVYTANVAAPFLLTQAVLPHLVKGSHIVNIGSMGGVIGTAKFPGLTAYSSSKGALSVLTECLAEELKPRGIAANCLALGAVQTEMLKAAFPGYQAPLTAAEMAAFIAEFVCTGHRFYNGKVLPVSSSTP